MNVRKNSKSNEVNKNSINFKVNWQNGVEYFEVLSFDGKEAISELYEFKITLRTKKFLSESDALGKRATLTINMSQTDNVSEVQTSSYHGVVYEFRSFGKSEGNFIYEATLAPNLAKLKYTKKSDVFVETGLQKILETVLTSYHSLTNTDYEIDLTSVDKHEPDNECYNRYSYICQYEESDWDFLNRLLERDGVYYYFEQNENTEKCVITDKILSYKDRNNDVKFTYYNGNHFPDPNTINYIESKSQMLPKEVTIKNFGYENAHLGDNGVISCSAFVSSDGEENSSLLGELVIYGENFVNPDPNKDGEFLATIRAQELLCQKKYLSQKVP